MFFICWSIVLGDVTAPEARVSFQTTLDALEGKEKKITQFNFQSYSRFTEDFQQVLEHFIRQYFKMHQEALALEEQLKKIQAAVQTKIDQKQEQETKRKEWYQKSQEAFDESPYQAKIEEITRTIERLKSKRSEMTSLTKTKEEQLYKFQKIFSEVMVELKRELNGIIKEEDYFRHVKKGYVPLTLYELGMAVESCQVELDQHQKIMYETDDQVREHIISCAKENRELENAKLIHQLKADGLRNRVSEVEKVMRQCDQEIPALLKTQENMLREVSFLKMTREVNENFFDHLQEVLQRIPFESDIISRFMKIYGQSPPDPKMMLSEKHSFFSQSKSQANNDGVPERDSSLVLRK